jgi:hypothetical protein
MKYLTWLYGTAAISGLIALGSSFVLRAAATEVELLEEKATRGGITGLIGAAAFGFIGTQAAKSSATGWRGKVFSAVSKKKRG